jgi:hypothetical protein
MAVNGTYKDVLQVFDLRKPTQDVLNRVCLAAASSKVAGCLPAIFGYVEGLNLGRAFMSMTADTALQVALKEKQEHNLKFLLDKGAWADETLNLAELALRQGYNNYVQKFLDRGVSPQEYLELAIKVAADDSIVGVLLEKGAYPCDVAIFAAIEDLPDYLGKLMSLRPPSDPMPISAVNHAIMQNSAYTLSIVLGLGGVIRDGDLQAAVLRKSEDMVKVLLDHNADVHGVDISSSGVVIKRMFEARYRTVWDHLEDW